jgi:acetolactate synthase-1/2/3 large subunit
LSFDALAGDIRSGTAPFVFGIPGGGPSLSLLDAMVRGGAFALTTRFEGSAAMMAATIGRLSGRPGVALGIKGPGLANMIPGLALARFEGFPMLAVTEAYKPGVPAARAHKRIDHAALASGVAKAHRFWSEQGPSAAALSGLSRAEVPGPVLLDIADGPITKEQPLPDFPAHRGDAGRVAERVARAQRPVIIAGALAIRQSWAPHLAELQVPVLTSVAAKGLIDETLPHAGGIYTGVGLDLTVEHALLPQCDLVVGLGVRSNEMLKSGFDCAAVNLDAVADGAPGFFFEAVAGPEAFASALAALAGRNWGTDIITKAKTGLDQILHSGPYLPASMFRVMNGAFDGQARIVMDTGYFCTIGEHACVSRNADLFLGSSQGRDMGVALPMAIAASLYDRTQPTILVIGDGGIGMYVGELKAAVEHKLPLLIIFMTNGGFGSILPRALSNGLVTAPLSMKEPSWLRAIEGIGFAVSAAPDEDSFAATLATWDRVSPLFVEASFEDAPYRAMVAGIRD